MKRFTNPKDALNYLRNEAKEGEEIILDERANAIHPRRVHYFAKQTEEVQD